MRGMWKHLERLGGGIGTRGPGESQLESDRRMARRRITLVRGRLRDVAARRDVMRQRAGAQRDAQRVAGRVHQRRQVDAPERAHRQPRQRQRPPVRDARPDHARLQRGRPLLPGDRHGRVHPQAAPPAGRGVRGHARGDAGRRPGAAGGRCVGGRGGAGRPARERARRAGRDRGRGDPAAAGAEQDRPWWTRSTRRRLANRNPDAVLVSARTGEGLDELKQRVAEFFADRYVDVQLLLPHSAAPSCRPCTSRARRSPLARTPPRACWCRRGCRSAWSAGSRPTAPTPRERSRVAIQTAASRRRHARPPPTPATPGSTCQASSGWCCSRAARRMVGTGLAVAIPARACRLRAAALGAGCEAWHRRG